MQNNFTTTPPPRREFSVRGMNCANCVRHVSEALQGVPGVASVTVSLEAGTALVRWQAGAAADVPAAVRAVQAAGYEAELVASRALGEDGKKLSGWRMNLWIGLLGTVPLILGEWVFGLAMERWFQWLAFALAAAVQGFAGAPFYRGAWRQLKIRAANMDTLVALGSTTAFAYSVWALFSGGGHTHLYFMESAAIIALISTGHWLEARMSARAAGSLKKLLNLAPPLARRRTPDGGEREMAVGELRAGDIIILKPGDRVPTDGEIAEGASAVDESMLTGEAVPVDKSAGAKLYAGTVNVNGRLLMRVTETGEATALAHIIAAVQRAQNSRAAIQRLGDRVSSVFVPVVVLVALAAALGWGLWPEQLRQVTEFLAGYLWPVHLPETVLAAAMVHAAAVLIIACPCAMGLATPVAIMAGTNAAAERGILIRDGAALEKAGTITSVIFDKTGTLTQGKPAVARCEIFDGHAAAPQLAAALARRSNHPLSQAVARLHAEDFPFTEWREVRGAGLEAVRSAASPARLRLGSLRWLRESGVDVTRGDKFFAEWSGRGATVLGLGGDQSLLALIAVEDWLKPGAAEVVAELRRGGQKVWLLTGDNARTAGAVAAGAGIDAEHVFAEVRPEEKAGFVRRLQERGEKVAFVGDGINDAPALEQADLGIAVSRASDIARAAADIILLKADIRAVPESLGLARATLRAIKQNLFWAFFYNAAGVPLAALGFLSPVLCALAMGLSDLVVIGNALRLRRWGR